MSEATVELGYEPGQLDWNREARLQYGREGEARLRAFFEEWLGRAIKWTVAEADDDYRGIDARVDAHFTVQVKRDAVAAETGNLFFELWRRRNSGPQIDSWGRAPVSYMHCHLVPVLGRIYMFRSDQMREVVGRWERDKSIRSVYAQSKNSYGTIVRCGLVVPAARVSNVFPPLRQGAEV